MSTYIIDSETVRALQAFIDANERAVDEARHLAVETAKHMAADIADIDAGRERAADRAMDEVAAAHARITDLLSEADERSLALTYLRKVREGIHEVKAHAPITTSAKTYSETIGHVAALLAKYRVKREEYDKDPCAFRRTMADAALSEYCRFVEAVSFIYSIDEDTIEEEANRIAEEQGRG